MFTENESILPMQRDIHVGFVHYDMNHLFDLPWKICVSYDKEITGLTTLINVFGQMTNEFLLFFYVHDYTFYRSSHTISLAVYPVGFQKNNSTKFTRLFKNGQKVKCRITDTFDLAINSNDSVENYKTIAILV